MRSLGKILMYIPLICLDPSLVWGQGLVIQPYPVPIENQAVSAPEKLESSAAMPEITQQHNSQTGQSAQGPLSVSASELMELDPEIVTHPLGGSVSKKSLSQLVESGPAALPKPDQAFSSSSEMTMVKPGMIIDPVPDPQHNKTQPELEAQAKNKEHPKTDDAPLALVDNIEAPSAAPVSSQPDELEQKSAEKLNSDTGTAGKSYAGDRLEKRPGLVYIRNGEILNADNHKEPSGVDQGDISGESSSDPFQAESGEDVKQVLERWSRKAGVTLIWKAPIGFLTLAPVANLNIYERAVQSLLDQHVHNIERPIAQLYQSPQTQERVLVVSLYQKI